MSTPHILRDKLGPKFESMAIGHGYNIEHGTCTCGASNCAYKSMVTGLAFAGFVMAFEWLTERNAILLLPD